MIRNVIIPSYEALIASYKPGQLQEHLCRQFEQLCGPAPKPSLLNAASRAAVRAHGERWHDFMAERRNEAWALYNLVLGPGAQQAAGLDVKESAEQKALEPEARYFYCPAPEKLYILAPTGRNMVFSRVTRKWMDGNPSASFRRSVQSRPGNVQVSFRMAATLGLPVSGNPRPLRFFRHTTPTSDLLLVIVDPERNAEAFSLKLGKWLPASPWCLDELIDGKLFAGAPPRELTAREALQAGLREYSPTATQAETDALAQRGEVKAWVQVGKKYRTRSGRVAEVRLNTGHPFYPFAGYVDGVAETWTPDGRVFLSDDREVDNDLMEEIVDAAPEAQAEPALVAEQKAPAPTKPEPAALKLEVGKRYRTRDGRIVTLIWRDNIEEDEHPTNYPWDGRFADGEEECWTDAGKLWVGDEEHGGDLVEEVKDEAPAKPMLKLEVGKKYRARNGKVFFIHATRAPSEKPFLGVLVGGHLTASWTAAGAHRAFDGVQNDFDLVAAVD